MPVMASLRTRIRKDRTCHHAVLYRHGGKQTSTSFEDLATATQPGSGQRVIDDTHIHACTLRGGRRSDHHRRVVSAHPHGGLQGHPALERRETVEQARVMGLADDAR